MVYNIKDICKQDPEVNTIFGPNTNREWTRLHDEELKSIFFTVQLIYSG